MGIFSANLEEEEEEDYSLPERIEKSESVFLIRVESKKKKT